MYNKSDLSHVSRLLESLGTLENLDAPELAEFADRIEFVSVARGELLLREGDEADALYLVLSGRFQVFRKGSTEPMAEIGAGYPIGEIAFFAGGPRTASVRAERDCLVLKVGRHAFDELAARIPGLWGRIAAALAQRLAQARSETSPRKHLPRTITICRAGASALPDSFIRDLRHVFELRSRCVFLDAHAFIKANPRHRHLEDAEATSWFNELESRYDHVFYLADAELTDWSRKCLRQTDLVLSVGQHDPSGGQPAEPNDLERFAADHCPSIEHRLVLVHDSHGPISGTRFWLDPRPWLRMHHHVARGHIRDYLRLARFIDGTALGLVAAGGGAFTAAHLGLYQALCEAGLEFDAMGGTSGGAAMTAAFATGKEIDEIERALEELFVKGRAFQRWTWPRYSLLDHTVLDRALAQHYGGLDIEDLWVPYFAVSTNLSKNEIYHHRRGPLWQAVRATGALPALLPPFYTDLGEMLVDGALLDNVPTSAMRSFKTGPNVVISFKIMAETHFEIDYEALPSRNQLLLHALNPFARRLLPLAPGPLSVLVRSLMVSRRKLEPTAEDGDLLLAPSLRGEMEFMNWQHHSLLRRQGYEYGVTELARLKMNKHPLLTDWCTDPPRK